MGICQAFYCLSIVSLEGMFWIFRMSFQNKKRSKWKTKTVFFLLGGLAKRVVWNFSNKKWAQWTFACFGMSLLNNHRLSGYQRGRGRPFTARMSLKREWGKIYDFLKICPFLFITFLRNFRLASFPFSSLYFKKYMYTYTYIHVYIYISHINFRKHLVWTRFTHFFIYLESNFWNEFWNKWLFLLLNIKSTVK